jgi:hypothetical protein
VNPKYDRSQVSSQDLTLNVPEGIGRERLATADHLADLAEFDARRLYLPEGFSSMFEYCVGRLRLSRERALKRIRIIRATRAFPVLYDAIADGRLHPSDIVPLASHLSPDNVPELIEAASGKNKAEIERYLAWRFTRRVTSGGSEVLPVSPGTPREKESTDARAASPGTPREAGSTDAAVGSPARPRAGESSDDFQVSLGAPPAVQSADGSQVSLGTPRAGESGVPPSTTDLESAHAARDDSGATGWGTAVSRVSPGTPPAPALVLSVAQPPKERVQVTIQDSALEKLRYLQSLLGHQRGSRDPAQVIERELDACIVEVEKQKFGATSRPHRGRSGNFQQLSRHIPAEVKRRVWERDGGRCAFVSDSGHRCETRSRLEFDHILEFARGGLATEGNIRLLCQAHNQYRAERAFGADFMKRKREESWRTASESRREAATSHGLEDGGVPG